VIFVAREHRRGMVSNTGNAADAARLTAQRLHGS